MTKTLDKKMRIVEITASLIALLYAILYQGFLQEKIYLGNYQMFQGMNFSLSFPNVVEDISLCLILLLFLLGKIRNTPWDKIIGVLYAVMIIPNKIVRIGYTVRAISNIGEAVEPLRVAASVIFDIIFIIGGVICALMYLGVVRFRKRMALLILMYALIIFGLFEAVYGLKTVSRVLIIIWGICFHNENAETDCKKGKTARTAVLLFIPLTIILEIAVYMAVFLNSISHITEDGSEGTAFIILFGIIVLCFVCIMLFPLLLFDKKFEDDETAEKNV